MKITSVTILTAIAALVGGCGESPTANSSGSQSTSPVQPSTPIQAEPFHGQVYKSLNGRTVLTLVSKDECELAEGGTTLLCKYSKPNGTLRIVVTTLGTSQVVYFRFTDQGLEDDKGNVLLSPERYAAAVAELQRQLQEKENSQKESKTVSNYALNSYDYGNGTKAPDELILTDVSIKLHYQKGFDAGPETIKFAEIVKISGVVDDQVNPWKDERYPPQFCVISPHNGYEEFTQSIMFGSRSDAQAVHDAVIKAFNTWKAKYPAAGSK